MSKENGKKQRERPKRVLPEENGLEMAPMSDLLGED